MLKFVVRSYVRDIANPLNWTATNIEITTDVNSVTLYRAMNLNNAE